MAGVVAITETHGVKKKKKKKDLFLGQICESLSKPLIKCLLCNKGWFKIMQCQRCSFTLCHLRFTTAISGRYNCYPSSSVFYFCFLFFLNDTLGNRIKEVKYQHSVHPKSSQVYQEQ